MIWFTLALFAVSFLLTALLTPKLEVENARPEDLDPANFPRATEDAPVPLLLGCGKIKGPNTLWYGNYESVPITEKIKTGLFSSKRVTVGYDYYLSIDLGLCLGPSVELKKIFIDDVEVNSGTTYYSETETVYYTETNIVGTAAPAINLYVIDLVADLGLTEAQIDAGNLVVDIKWHFRVTSGSNQGTWLLDSGAYANTLGTGSKLTPNEGLAATVFTQTNGDADMEVLWTIPAGARSVSYYVQLAPLFPFGFNVTVDLQEAGISGFGITFTNINFDINEPDLYGGRKSGGGHVGNVNYYPGEFDQIVDPHVEASVGAGLVPAYRGQAHIVYINHNIGERPALRKMEFLLAKYNDLISNGYGGKIGPNASDVDMDPAEALYFILTDTWAGIGVDASDIDLASFQSASATLVTEGNGVTVIVSGAKSAKSILTEILRQVDGILYQDGPTGKIKLKLIRDDYVAGSLPIYDQGDIIKVLSFNKTAWEDVKSQVKVSYNSNDTEGTKVAIAINEANVGQMGRLRTAEISFPFCYSAATAAALAARELSVLSVPLFRMQVQMNRNGYALVPGDVIKVSWPEYGLTEIIMRVQKIDVGALLDNKIVVDLIQDVFAVSDVVIAAPEDSSWVDDRPVPETVLPTIVEMPYFLASQLEYPVADGFASVIPFAVQPKTQSTAFDLLWGTTTGTLEFYDPQQVEYPLTGLLVGGLDELDGFETGLHAAGITVDGLVGPNTDTDVPEAATTAETRTGEKGLIYINGEWLTYEGVTDNGGGSYTLTNVRRGVLGTRPLTHADNTRVFFLSVDLLGDGTMGDNLLEDGTLYYKLLDRVGGTTRAAGAETEQSATMQDIADRPLRPRNLQLNSARTEVPFNISSDPTPTLSWVGSNREAGQITFENDADETPDQTEQYDLEVWIDGVDETGTYGASNITSPYAGVNLSAASGTVGEFRLYSKRTGGDGKSSVYYAKYPFIFGVAKLSSTSVTLDETTTTMDQSS